MSELSAAVTKMDSLIEKLKGNAAFDAKAFRAELVQRWGGERGLARDVRDMFERAKMDNNIVAASNILKIAYETMMPKDSNEDPMADLTDEELQAVLVHAHQSFNAGSPASGEAQAT